MNFSSENADLRFDRTYKDSMTASLNTRTATIKVRAPMNGSEPLPHSQQAHLEVKQVLVSSAAGGLNGQMDVPGDKSISHRSLILAGMAVGRTNIKGLLRGEDVLSTLRAMQQLGVTIIDDADTDSVSVDGVGTGGFISPEAPLDLGNAGTGVRLIMGQLPDNP